MLPIEHGRSSRRYLLRWRFEYKDGKPPKYGMWSAAPKKDDYANQAWCHNSNVAFAIVEGKNIATKEVKPVVVCAGDDFVNFEIIALALTPALALKRLREKKITELTPPTLFAGISLRTRYEVLEVFETGDINRRPRPPEDMDFNYATFGR